MQRLVQTARSSRDHCLRPGIVLGGLLLWGASLLILLFARVGRIVTSILVNVAGSVAMIVGGAFF